MKQFNYWLLISLCFLSSCTMKPESRINISLDLNSYEIKNKTAVEEIKRSRIVKNITEASLMPIDSSIVSPKPIIDEIRNDEYIFLIYSSGMCFHMVNTKCAFKKIGSKVYGIFGGEFVVELNEGQMEKIRQFELRLFEVNRFACIVSDDCSDEDKEYEFYLGQRKRTYHYNTCDHRNLLQLLIADIVANGKRIKN